jgi:hypothetical protein
MERKSPVRPLIVGAILVVVFLLLGQVLPRFLPDETAQWVSFFSILLAILSGFICLISFASRVLSGRVAARLFGLVEIALIAGIVLGIFGMFQPWVLSLYPIGFIVLFASTWMFTLWGYVTPKPAHSTEE